MKTDVRNAIEIITEKYGPPNVAVNCAGVGKHGSDCTPVEHLYKYWN